MSDSLEQANGDYQVIEAAIRWLDAHREAQPELADVAAAAGMSASHLQRLFTRWVGISPKRFLQYLTIEHAKTLLDESRSVLDTALGAGLSGPGRLHDLFIGCEAVTPGQYGRRGEGLAIGYGTHPTPFGTALLGVTERGICFLAFADHGGDVLRDALRDLRARWPRASLCERPETTGPLVRRIFGGARSPGLAGSQGGAPVRSGGLSVWLHGTNFQIRVWEALLRIPAGRVVSYGDLARSMGRPEAARAVAGAVGSNPVSYLIPCHRVIRGLGGVGGYRWGIARKRAILAWESAGRESAV